jgi:hypothetical protein
VKENAMATCETCGIDSGRKRFCDDFCESQFFVNQIRSIDDVVAAEVTAVHQGKCPRCGGDGPVDVQQYFFIWSIIIGTFRSTNPLVLCNKCASKYQLAFALISGIVGWWGFPWGILLTPVYIGKNLWYLVNRPEPIC